MLVYTKEKQKGILKSCINLENILPAFEQVNMLFISCLKFVIILMQMGEGVLLISVMLLAYREADNLRVLLPKIIEQMNNVQEEYEINVIDTKEPTDDTSEVCKELGANYYNQELPGFGGAYKKGLSVAKGDSLLALDSDGSHDPKCIPDIIAKYKEGYNVVIGSRYVKGGETFDKKSSQIMSHILNFVFGLVMGIKAKDLSTNFRIYNMEQLRKVDLTCVNYDVLEEVLVKIKAVTGKKDFKLAESPISFNKRLYGESKRRLIPFMVSYVKTIFKIIGIRIKSKI